MLELIKNLKKVMEEKKIKSSTAAIFIKCSSRQVDRWLKGESIPNLLYREAIKRAIKRMKNL